MKTLITSFTILAAIYMLLILLPMALENIIDHTVCTKGKITISCQYLEP